MSDEGKVRAISHIRAVTGTQPSSVACGDSFPPMGKPLRSLPRAASLPLRQIHRRRREGKLAAFLLHQIQNLQIQRVFYLHEIP